MRSTTLNDRCGLGKPTSAVLHEGCYAPIADMGVKPAVPPLSIMAAVRPRPIV